MVGYREEMDYFENHSYWFIRLILFYTGLWPYSARRTRLIKSSVQFFAITMLTLFSLLKFIMLFPSVESIIYTLTLLSVCFIAFPIHVFAYVCNIVQLKELWEIMEKDWKELEKMNKISIAERYAGKGNLLSLYVTILIFIYYVLAFLETFLPYLLDVIQYREPNVLKIPIAVELFGKYDLSLTIVLLIFLILTGIIVAICISEFILFVHHACLLFSLTGDMLEHGFINIEKKNNATDKDEILYKAIVESIKCHRTAIGFSKIIEDTYTLISLYLVAAVITMLTSNSLRLFHMTLSHNVFSAIITLFCLFCIVGLVFLVTHTGQLLIDHSLDVFNKAYSVPWYIASLKSQKLLLVILTRTIKPSYLTHGKMAILCHAIFTMLLHSAISVTTVFISVR